MARIDIVKMNAELIAPSMPDAIHNKFSVVRDIQQFEGIGLIRTPSLGIEEQFLRSVLFAYVERGDGAAGLTLQNEIAALAKHDALRLFEIGQRMNVPPKLIHLRPFAEQRRGVSLFSGDPS